MGVDEGALLLDLHQMEIHGMSYGNCFTKFDPLFWL
jgi:hypothetical protein